MLLDYQPRGTIHCLSYEKAVSEPCWGIVRYSSSEIYRCEGHYHTHYIPKPVPMTEAEFRDLQTAQRKQRRETETDQAVREFKSRWYFPLLGWYVGPPNLFWEGLSTPMASGLLSIVGEGLGIEELHPTVKEKTWDLAVEGVALFNARRLSFPAPPYDLKLATRDPYQRDPFPQKVLSVNWRLLSNDQLQIIYGLAAWVTDYSCLNNGFRQVLTTLWVEGGEEVSRRQLPDTSDYLPDLVL